MLWLIHTVTTAIRIATPVTAEIAKSYMRPRPWPLFKTLVKCILRYLKGIIQLGCGFYHASFPRGLWWSWWLGYRPRWQALYFMGSIDVALVPTSSLGGPISSLVWLDQVLKRNIAALLKSQLISFGFKHYSLSYVLHALLPPFLGQPICSTIGSNLILHVRTKDMEMNLLFVWEKVLPKQLIVLNGLGED